MKGNSTNGNGNNNDHNRETHQSIRLGLRPNINQFHILVLVNAFVGTMVGLEQTVVPLIGRNEFGLESNALIVSFIASFGAVKAVLNLFAGNMSDKWGRKSMLVLGWLFGLPVPSYYLLLTGTGWALPSRLHLVFFKGILTKILGSILFPFTNTMRADIGAKSRFLIH